MLAALKALFSGRSPTGRPDSEQAAPPSAASQAGAAVQKGNTCLARDRLADAETQYRFATALDPTHAAAWIGLGYVLKQHGEWEQASDALRRALLLQPRQADAHFMQGGIAAALGQDAEAVRHFRTALTCDAALQPVYPDLALALFRQGEVLEALSVVGQGLALFPDHAAFHFYRGNLLASVCQPGQAVESYRKALELLPSYAEAMAGLGNSLGQTGRTEEALVFLRQALELQPENAAWYSDLLFNLQYQGGSEADALFQAHLRFAELFERPLRAQWTTHTDPFDPQQRRLKIGYVSGDLRGHSMAFFIEPVLRLHDRQQVEVYCYYTHPVHDAVTGRLRRLVDQWRSCATMSDDALAQQIRADGIDVLVDLSGHTGYNRLLVFARKPAPVQVTWLGYQATTGLSAMDYRITDEAMDSPGQTEAYHSEKLLRLSQAGVFQPDMDSPPVSALPCLARGIFTFGCLNNPAKITPAYLDAACAILRQTTSTRLLVGSMDAQTRPLLLDAFAERGVAADRLLLVDKKPFAGYLELHHDIDLALDTFPYNGGTTTMHSLWMGVPVLAIDGEASIARVGASVMRGLGYGTFACTDEADYVAKAVALVENPQQLVEIRRTARDLMTTVAVRAAQRLTRELEEAFRQARLRVP